MNLNEARGIVTKYIYVRKKERIYINPYKINNQEQVEKLNHAVKVALDFFENNKIVI